jgi:predicted Zn finger-like uncharacterized protein
VQANCPQCSQKIAIDDAKVPDRPFNVRCPKCQNVVKLPGRGGAAVEAAAPAPPAPPAPAPSSAPMQATITTSIPSIPAMSDDVRAQLMAQLKKEMHTGGEDGAVEKALVVFPDPGQSAGISQTLARLGYGVETVDDFDEGARQLEQGAYAVVATARVGAQPGKPESLYQRMLRLSPEARRRVFVILVGDEFRSGDSTQGFVTLADLVLHTKDAPTADGYIKAYQTARRRLFQPMEEARKRVEMAVI